MIPLCLYVQTLNVIRICGKDVACSTCKLLIYKSRGEQPKMYRNSNFIFLCPWKYEKKHSKVGYHIGISEIFSTADRPKTRPNFKFCFIKLARRMTYIQWIWLHACKLSWEIVELNLELYVMKYWMEQLPLPWVEFE